MMENSFPSAPSDRNLTEEACELLRRYPDLQPRELERLIEIFPKLSISELGLLASYPGVTPKLDVFRQEQGARLQTPLVKTLLLVLGPAVLLYTMFWLFWHAFNGE